MKVKGEIVKNVYTLYFLQITKMQNEIIEIEDDVKDKL
jgi:hypothetical protein